MFTCSDAAQQDMMKDIREQNLDGMVVASCSPKLHLRPSATWQRGPG